MLSTLTLTLIVPSGNMGMGVYRIVVRIDFDGRCCLFSNLITSSSALLCILYTCKGFHYFELCYPQSRRSDGYLYELFYRQGSNGAKLFTVTYHYFSGSLATLLHMLVVPRLFPLTSVKTTFADASGLIFTHQANNQSKHHTNIIIFFNDGPPIFHAYRKGILWLLY